MSDMTTDPNSEAALPPAAEERELCPSCLTGNVPGRNFCTKCGAPLSCYAAIGPFEHLFAEGHIYRTAAERPHKFIVVMGIWLIFAPAALICAALALTQKQENSPLGILFMFAIVAISVTLIVKTTRNYITRRTSTRRTEGEPTG